VSRAIEALAAAIEALAPRLPGGLPATATDRLDEARWELKNL
jgi:hypothetical protein